MLTDNDIKTIRKDFPFFDSEEGKRTIYFDNAATTQRCSCVLEAERRFSAETNANPLRGLYALSVKATEAYEKARHTAASFIGAKEDCEVIFTRNATEAINLAASSYGASHLNAGDEVAISIMEHHSNMLPWAKVAKERGAKVVWLYCDKETGQLPLSEVKAKVGVHTKVVAIGQVSNVLGTINDIKAISEVAHKAGAVVMVDGAQSVPHIKVDVNSIGADFLAFSAHKMTGPFGVGVLWGKKELLNDMPPFLRGGEMIESVRLASGGGNAEDASAADALNVTYAPLPAKFEAGTVNASGAVGLAQAIDYLAGIGMDDIAQRDGALAARLINEMINIPHLHIVGNTVGCGRTGIVSFTLDGAHPHDIASVLDSEGVSIRAGFHCAEPLSQYLGGGKVMPTARASVYFYNTEEEVDIFACKLRKVRGWLGFKD